MDPVPTQPVTCPQWPNLSLWERSFQPHTGLVSGQGTVTVGAVTVMTSLPQAEEDGLKASGSVGVKSAVQ